MAFQVEALEALLDDAERAFAVSGDEPYEASAGRPMSVLANVPAAIAFLRAVLARLRGDAALAAGYNRQALAQLGEDDWLMRSFVRWNQAVADWLGGRLGSRPSAAWPRGARHEPRRSPPVRRRVLRWLSRHARLLRPGPGAARRRATWMRRWRPTGRRSTRPARAASRPTLGMAHVGLAQVLYERNELAAALDHATRGVTLCRQLAFTHPLATGLAVVARIRHVHGDAAGALEAMGKAGQAGLSPQVIALTEPAAGAAAAGPGRCSRGRPVGEGSRSETR